MNSCVVCATLLLINYKIRCFAVRLNMICVKLRLFTLFECEKKRKISCPISVPDVDECLENPAACGGHSVCENTLGGYKCVCAAGYRGNSTHCEGKQTCPHVPLPEEVLLPYVTCLFVSLDENECASGFHGCDPNARCGNIIGSYFCQCYQGFNGDGRSCFGGFSVFSGLGSEVNSPLCGAQRPA